MRETTLPESGAKRNLFDAAQQLIAEKGFEAVSVRDITRLAKTNVAAINYHFGNRDALLGMVMTRCIVPINEERLARLEASERKWPGKVVPLEELIDAFVRPLVTQARKSDLPERLFYKLTGQIFAEQGDGVSKQIEDQLRQIIERFTRSFAKALPTVATDDLVWRIHFLVGGMIHMLTHQDGIHRLPNAAAVAPTMEATLSRFIRFAAAGLREGTEPAEPGPKGPQTTFDF